MRCSRHGTVPLVLAVLVALPSCSLLDLDGFAVLSCDRGTQCEPINTRDGVAPDACARWVCDRDAHTCFFGTRDDDGDTQAPPSCGGTDCDDADPERGFPRIEICDGIDNDCDLAIDDLETDSLGSLVGDQDVVAVFPNSAGARYGSSGATHAAIAIAGVDAARNRGALVLLDGASVGTPSDIDHQAPASDAFGERSFVAGCPQRGFAEPAECDEADGALTGNGSSWLVATITARGCGGAGELRIGALASSGETHVRHQGPDERSHIWYGVGTSTTPGCTTSPDGAQGARAPVLSSLSGREALGAYLADAQGATCEDDDTVEVEALGLWLTEAPDATWVEATGNGVPTPMGNTRSFGGPSLASWPGQGWLLAFGDAAGGVALRFAATPLPTPPPSPESGVIHETDPLPRVDLPTVFSAPVERVAIALGRIVGRTAEVGIAVQQGCGDATIQFSRVALDLDLATATPIGAPIELGAGEEPVLAHVDTGMRVDVDRPGGFVVLFVAPRGMIAARIADATGALVGEPFEVGAGTRSPSLYAGESPGTVRYAYQSGDELIGGSLFCASMAAD